MYMLIKTKIMRLMLWAIPEKKQELRGGGGGGGGGGGSRNAPILYPYNDLFHAETPTVIYPNE